MPHSSLRILKNAASNVVRGGSTAAVSFALPHFLVRELDVNRFAAWSLMLQIAAYASFLDFGLQMAITRYVAQSTELGLVERRRKVIQTSLCLLLIAAAISIFVITIVLANSKSVFHGVPVGILREFQRSGLILGAGTAIQLVFSAFSGTLVGLHRNELVALATVGGRVAGAIAVVVLSRFTHSLIVLASAITVATILAGIVQWNAVMRLLPELRPLCLTLDRVVMLDLYHFCVGLTAWMLSMFMISGLDVTIVAHFQFSQVGYYSIAVSATSLLVGFDSAVLSALLAPLAAFHAKNETFRISATTLNVSWGNTTANGIVLLIFLLFGHTAMRLWVGTLYADRTMGILTILLLAQAIRLVCSPFAVMLVSCGLHSRGIASGVAEGVVNLALSCYLVRIYGAIGVAYGTLIGAIISLLIHLTYTLRKAHQIPMRRSDLLISAMGLPLLTLLPLGVFSVLVVRGSLLLGIPGLVGSAASTGVLIVWTWRLQHSRGALLLGSTHA
jgi:O-antigen/teichoic acid export membrane protein